MSVKSFLGFPIVDRGPIIYETLIIISRSGDLPAMIILQNWIEPMSPLPLRRFKASMNGTSFDVTTFSQIESKIHSRIVSKIDPMKKRISQNVSINNELLLPSPPLPSPPNKSAINSLFLVVKTIYDP